MVKFRYRLSILHVLVFFAAVFAFSAPAQAMEVIKSYHSDIEVARSGKLTVTETIMVSVEHDRIRHGIYRDFPLTFTGSDGQMHRIDFSIVDIKRDGQDEQFKTNSLNNGVRILIGKDDTLVPTGDHTYEIKYETGRQIRYFPDHDELFWNVTGNGWEFPIQETTATVILPPDVKSAATVFYTGAPGATEKNARVTEADGRIFFATTEPLGQHEGLTIGVKFAKGAILQPTSGDNFWWILHDRMNAIAAGAGFILVFLFFSIQWWRIGRDPARGVVVPRWDPPAGLSPALVNYVANRGFNHGGWTAFSASAIDLAVKGLITLEDLTKTVMLKRTDKAPADKLPLGEDKIYNAVKTGYFAISKDNGTRLQSLGSSFRSAIDKEHSGKYHRYNAGTIALGIILTIIAFIAVLAIGDFTSDMLGLMVVPVVIFLFVAIFSAVLSATALSSPSVFARVFAGILLTAFWLAFVVIIVSAIWAAVDAARSPDDSIAYVVCLAMIMIAAFFSAIMGAATPLGRELHDGIEGLKLYLTVAEKQRMNMAGAPQMSPQHYETLLPYAVALGVERPWSDHFQHWLDAAGAAAVASYQPLWYSGDNFDSGRFGDRISSFSSSLPGTISASLPTPTSDSSSSGFSSGGSSGGGGGGGGGGGW